MKVLRKKKKNFERNIIKSNSVQNSGLFVWGSKSVICKGFCQILMSICNFLQKLIINDQTPFKMADFVNIFKLIKILVVRQEFCQKYGISKIKFQFSRGKFIGLNQSFKGVFFA